MYPIITKTDSLCITETFVAMADGVKLYTRIITPAVKDKFPVLFIRTPYEKALKGVPFDVSSHEYDIYVKHGYAVIVQHTRGRGDSEGECHPYKERDDGLCTLDYIRTLPFYNGEIYLWGGSYLSTAHLSYFSAKPKDIKGAVIDIQTDRMYYRNYRNGCCYKFCNINWWSAMLNRRYPNASVPKKLKRPYCTADTQIFGEEVPEYTALFLNDKCNDYWKSYESYNASEAIAFPILFRGGWYDFYLEGMFDMWSRLKKETREKSAFVVGPWGHSIRLSEKNELPINNHALSEDHAVEWFDSIREKRSYKYAEYGKVNFHSIGGDKWETALYPKKHHKYMRLYFNPDNILSFENSDGEVTYRFDPQNENKLFEYGTARVAAPVNTREDVISFTSDEFHQDTDFFGGIKWHMKVSSTCDDSAFFIRIHLVRDGKAYNLTETIAALSYINPEYKRNEVQLLDLVTPPVGFTLKKGDRIRIDISSDGSLYVRHSNLKCHWAKAPKTRVAVNTLYFDEGFIEIPYHK